MMETPTNNETYSKKKQSPNSKLSGILFSRSRGCTFTSLSLVVVDNDNDELNGNVREELESSSSSASIVLVRIQFPNANGADADDNNSNGNKELRSFCRRTFKIGDRLEILCDDVDDVKTIETKQNDDNDSVGNDKQWHDQRIKVPRIVIDCSSTKKIKKHVFVQESRAWNMKKCQELQQRFYDSRRETNDTTLKKQQQQQSSSGQQRKEKQTPKQKDPRNDNVNNGHGAGFQKRMQGEHLAMFLIDMIEYKLSLTEERIAFASLPNKNLSQFSDWPTISSISAEEAKLWRSKAIEYLNSGSGVVDVAGGSGHVSMALGMMGVKSTVVDPRERVGMLPGRDRKIWNRALKNKQKPNSNNVLIKNNDNNNNNLPDNNDYYYCQPVVPYQKYRSWFGFRPDGVDSSFRHPDQDEIPTCDEYTHLICSASAIVALHPDEATTDSVRIAVKRRIPFVIVPCCVFARLFPNRKIQATQRNVSTYEDLLGYLLEQDSSIHKEELPFDGKNIALWSIFDNTESA